jgi:hypothetical protein
VYRDGQAYGEARKTLTAEYAEIAEIFYFVPGALSGSALKSF